MRKLFSVFAGVLKKPVQGRLFAYLLMLNAVSNCCICIHYQQFVPILCMLTLAGLTAYVESAVCMLIRFRWLRLLTLLLFVVVHNLLIVADYFLVYQFHMALGQDAVDVLAETNAVEAANFLETYLNGWNLLLWLLFLVALNYVLLLLSRFLSRINFWAHMAILIVVCGVAVMGTCVYNFSVYRDGMSIPQFQTPTRIGYALYVLHQRQQKIVMLRAVCSSVRATTVDPADSVPTVVVVIGESFCTYHSSLYGYEKPTNPNLGRRVSEGSLRVFDDVVSIACATHGAMLSVFSVDSLGVSFGEQPLFPACFKAAGYRTFMYDNQYFVGMGVTFLTDRELSNQLFDYRNADRATYDLSMVQTIEPQPEPALYVIHLWGQHYTYAERYPSDFARFTAADYDPERWTESQREVMAHYDNATLYNDYVVDQIIKKFEHQNCVVVYFSDHGEEIYDLNGYMGHGNAEHTSDLSYQLRVPFMVWTSPTFSRPDVARRIDAATHLPAMTDDVPHLLFDLAGIATDCFKPTHSVVSEEYDVRKQRVVLHSIDYDRTKK